MSALKNTILLFFDNNSFSIALCDAIIRPIVIFKFFNTCKLVYETVPFLNVNVCGKPNRFFKRILIIAEINDYSASYPYIICFLTILKKLLILLYNMYFFNGLLYRRRNEALVINKRILFF